VSGNQVAAILRSNRVSFVWSEREFADKRLLRFYTPQIGNYYEALQQVEQDRYIWVPTKEHPPELVEQCDAVGEIRGWRLIYVTDNCNVP
jgi:hypothetical protein